MEVRLPENARQRVKHGLASAQQTLGAVVLRLQVIKGSNLNHTRRWGIGRSMKLRMQDEEYDFVIGNIRAIQEDFSLFTNQNYLELSLGKFLIGLLLLALLNKFTYPTTRVGINRFGESRSPS